MRKHAEPFCKINSFYHFLFCVNLYAVFDSFQKALRIVFSMRQKNAKLVTVPAVIKEAVSDALGFSDFIFYL